MAAATHRSGTPSAAAVATEASRLYRYGKIALATGLRELRPWRDFLSNLAVPTAQAGWPAFEQRVASNLWYWRSNYAALALGLSAYVLLSRPRLLAAAALVAALARVSVLERLGRNAQQLSAVALDAELSFRHFEAVVCGFPLTL